MMQMGAVAAAIAGISVAACAKYGWGGLMGLVIPLFVFVSAAGFIIANAIIGALEKHPQSAGSVSALLGATQYGTGIIGSAAVGALANGTPVPMGMVMAGFGIACGASALLTVPLRTRPDTASVV